MKIWSVFLACCLAFAGVTDAPAAEKPARSGTVIYTIRLNTEAGRVGLWLPYPCSGERQIVSDVKLGGTFGQPVMSGDPDAGTATLYASWTNPKDNPQLNLLFHVAASPASPAELKDSGEAFPEDVRPYLVLDKKLSSSRAVRDAVKAVGEHPSTLETARAAYDWVIGRTAYNPSAKGCGRGDPLRTLGEDEGRGGSADISAVFVTVARAAGVPAREVVGLILPEKSGEITDAFHVWAEFYLPGTGWVTVDPALVRKSMRMEDLRPGDAATARRAQLYFGNDALFRLALSRSGRAVTLDPAQKGGPLPYFGYPYAEADGKPLDFLKPQKFMYQIDFKADH